MLGRPDSDADRHPGNPDLNTDADTDADARSGLQRELRRSDRTRASDRMDFDRDWFRGPVGYFDNDARHGPERCFRSGSEHGWRYWFVLACAGDIRGWRFVQL